MESLRKWRKCAVNNEKSRIHLADVRVPSERRFNSSALDKTRRPNLEMEREKHVQTTCMDSYWTEHMNVALCHRYAPWLSNLAIPGDFVENGAPLGWRFPVGDAIITPKLPGNIPAGPLTALMWDKNTTVNKVRIRRICKKTRRMRQEKKMANSGQKEAPFIRERETQTMFHLLQTDGMKGDGLKVAAKTSEKILFSGSFDPLSTILRCAPSTVNNGQLIWNNQFYSQPVKTYTRIADLFLNEFELEQDNDKFRDMIKCNLQIECIAKRITFNRLILI